MPSSAQMRPPCPFMISLTIESPSPLPLPIRSRRSTTLAWTTWTNCLEHADREVVRGSSVIDLVYEAGVCAPASFFAPHGRRGYASSLPRCCDSQLLLPMSPHPGGPRLGTQGVIALSNGSPSVLSHPAISHFTCLCFSSQRLDRPFCRSPMVCAKYGLKTADKRANGISANAVRPCKRQNGA